MSEFEYLETLSIIIVGLALTNIMTSVHKLVEAGPRVRWHWGAVMTTLFAAIVSLGFLWVLLANRASQPAHPLFIGFLLVWATNLALLFFICAASLPDEVPHEGINLRDFYFGNRRRFFGFAAVFYLCNCLQNAAGMVLGGVTAKGLVFLLSNAVGVLASTSLIYFRAAWWHALVLSISLVAALLLYGPVALP